jgi:zinc protease
VARARAVILGDLKDIQAKKVTLQELHQAKLMLLRDIPLSESSVNYIAEGWLSRSGLGLPLDEPTRAAQVYVKLQARDVKAAYAKWLRPDDLVEVVQGPVPR